MREFMCPECGTQIITNHGRQKFCCKKCQKRNNGRTAYKKIHQNCHFCNGSLKNVKYMQRFCSNSCALKSRNLRRERRAYLKKKHIIEMLGSKCNRCSYNKCIRALQFHHRDPSKKNL